MPQENRYPKPGAVGGRLIRDVIGFLRSQKIELPITSHILIAVSGGPDSMALAHLLLKYGRRIVERERVTLLHVDHGWRKKSAADARFVAAFAKRWKVPLQVKKLKAPDMSESYEGRSWEEVARDSRKEFYREAARKKKATVLTAHQADDLAETLLWRLFTGSASTHGGGIAVQHGVELRPFLAQRKGTLLAYLKEEKQDFRDDETNRDTRFLRARIRAEIVPAIERIFPRAVEHLVRQGLDAQASSAGQVPDEGPAILFQAAGIRGRRAHWEAILEGQSEMDLPGGWKLTRQVDARDGSLQRPSERWTLERFLTSVSRRNGKEKESI